MKKWANLAAVIILAALLIWAGSRFSTAMARLAGFVDTAVLDGETRFIDENLDFTPTLPPQELELTDQDYDAAQPQSDAQEDISPKATDYLTDGDEMMPVDETIEELADE